MSNRLVELPMRTNHVTLTKTMWEGFLTKDQKKNGLSQNDISSLMAQITQEWCLRHPIAKITFDGK